MDNETTDTSDKTDTIIQEKLDREEAAVTAAERGVAVLTVKTKLRAGRIHSEKEWQE